MKVRRCITRLKRRKGIFIAFVLFLVLTIKLLNFFVFGNEKMEVLLYRMIKSYKDKGLIRYETTQSLCQDHDNTPLKLLIMISSRITHFHRRTALRKSWISLFSSNDTIRYSFVIGRSESTVYNDAANTERNVFNDIILLDLEDTDDSEASKTIGILNWTHKNCAKVQYLLKINDDTFLNIYTLNKYLKRNKQENAIIGCKTDGSENEHFLQKYLFRHLYFSTTVQNVHPVYIKSSAYLITGDIISKLYMATNHVQHFCSEDKYITGLCREYIKAEAVGHSGFSCGYRDKGPCGSNFRYAITGNQYYPDELVRMWKELNNRWSDCRLIDNYWISIAFDTVKKYMF
ncbi:beta-1,3-galactosyltransferase 1-like [Saccostrea cucullata]|uniref:beta-1,3-galactosyltransferase 1-like n=1 Tax=Saccostrea cuccullata TaxID=36930 RepID=UPI002ED279EF